MDSVSLPVVSATAPPPPRAASSTTAGAARAAPPAGASRADGRRLAGPHASDESRNFDDVLSDVHAAKDDKTSARATTAKTDEDKDDATAAPQSDAVQAPTAAVAVAVVPLTAPEATPKAAVAHIGGTADCDHQDRSAAEAITVIAGSGQPSGVPVAVVAPVSSPQAPPAETARGSAKAASTGVAKKPALTVGSVPASTTTQSLNHKKLPKHESEAAAAAVTADPFTPELDQQESAKDAPDLTQLKRQAEAGPVSSSERKVAAAGEPPVPVKVSSSNAVAQSELKNKVSSQVSELLTRATPAETPGSPVATASPSAGHDVVTHASPGAVRRAASRAAAQTVIGKVLQREANAADVPAAASADQASTDSARHVAQRPVAGAAAGPEAAKTPAKVTIQRPQAGDAISIAAAVTSARADTAAGERRGSGQGSGGQEPGAQAKQLLVSAATGSVVVAPQDVRQAFERMVRDVTAPTSTLDASSGAAVNDQIVRGMQLQMKGNVGEARITLAPEHLGEVVVEMRVEKDGVVATLRADTPAVRGWLATHQDDLRAGLADVGLRLDDLQVSERESRRERQQAPADQQAQTPRRARRTSAGELPRFEVEA